MEFLLFSMGFFSRLNCRRVEALGGKFEVVMHTTFLRPSFFSAVAPWWPPMFPMTHLRGFFFGVIGDWEGVPCCCGPSKNCGGVVLLWISRSLLHGSHFQSCALFVCPFSYPTFSELFRSHFVGGLLGTCKDLFSEVQVCIHKELTLFPHFKVPPLFWRFFT